MPNKQMRTFPKYAGIWCYLENRANEVFSAFLRTWQPSHLWERILPVPVTHAVVSRILPQELQENAQSWLILYRADFPQDLLILPFPEQSGADHNTDNPATFCAIVLAILEIVCDDVENWNVHRGYRNLVDHLAFRKHRRVPQNWPLHRFLIIRLPKPLEEVLIKHALPVHHTNPRTIMLFTTASQNIQHARERLLVPLLTDGDPDRVQELLENFETTILQECDRLGGQLEPHIPPICSAFEQVMDDDTKRFLASCETVTHFATIQRLNEFDFSLCACGLWKAVERELNSSLIQHLRFTNGLLGKDGRPSITGCDKTVNYEAGSKTLNINRRQRGSIEFEGITLGDIKYLIRSARDNTLAKEVRPALVREPPLLAFLLCPGRTGLAHVVGQVAHIRNAHAHIKAMDQQAYQELRSIVIDPYDEPRTSLLGKILRMKQAFVDYWNSLHM